MKGASSYEETGDSWVKCKKLGKQFIKVSIGPISCNQITACPPFWVTWADLFCPVVHHVLGRERSTQCCSDLDCKGYIFCRVCLVTKLVVM